MVPPALEEAQQAELKAAVQELPAEAGIGFRLCLIQRMSENLSLSYR